MNVNKITFGFVSGFILVCLLILSMPMLANAEIYMWTDETGKKHFSNVSPGNETIDRTINESKSDETFDPSMNAVSEEEIEASIEKRRIEAEERQIKLEEERIAQQKRQLGSDRKAEEKRSETEVKPSQNNKRSKKHEHPR